MRQRLAAASKEWAARLAEVDSRCGEQARAWHAHVSTRDGGDDLRTEAKSTAPIARPLPRRHPARWTKQTALLQAEHSAALEAERRRAAEAAAALTAELEAQQAELGRQQQRAADLGERLSAAAARVLGALRQRQAAAERGGGGGGDLEEEDFSGEALGVSEAALASGEVDHIVAGFEVCATLGAPAALWPALSLKERRGQRVIWGPVAPLLGHSCRPHCASPT